MGPVPYPCGGWRRAAGEDDATTTAASTSAAEPAFMLPGAGEDLWVFAR